MAETTTQAPAAAGNERGNSGKGRGERRERRDDREKEKNPFMERVVFINRVSKVVKGGRRFSFTALLLSVTAMVRSVLVTESPRKFQQRLLRQ